MNQSFKMFPTQITTFGTSCKSPPLIRTATTFRAESLIFSFALTSEPVTDHLTDNGAANGQ